MLKIDKVYDNEELFDRYTIIFTSGDALALSENPLTPGGFMHWILVDDYDEARLGRKISFQSLPESIQEYIWENFNY